jgi:tetratricopeptide (TPR) repeat protein
MSEMLANHYYLLRNFPLAKNLFEKILKGDSTNNALKNKLIICYVTTGEIQNAIGLFLDQIQDDIDSIINTKVDSDDCPCPEIISEIENNKKLFKKNSEKFAALGILWLYCSLEKSIEFFKNAENADPNETRFKEVSKILLNKLIHNKSNSIN